MDLEPPYRTALRTHSGCRFFELDLNTRRTSRPCSDTNSGFSHSISLPPARVGLFAAESAYPSRYYPISLSAVRRQSVNTRWCSMAIQPPSPMCAGADMGSVPNQDHPAVPLVEFDRFNRPRLQISALPVDDLCRNGFSDRLTRLRFLREARAAAGIRHPNVASVFHLGKIGELTFTRWSLSKAKRWRVSSSAPASLRSTSQTAHYRKRLFWSRRGYRFSGCCLDK